MVHTKWVATTARSMLFQQLKNGIIICAKGDVTLFNTPYPTLVQQVRQNISALGCTFIDNEAEADWVIRLYGVTHENDAAQIKGYTAYVVMAEVDMEIAKQGQIIYAGHISKKGVHTSNPATAAKEAYTDVSKEIAEKINKEIA